MGTQFEGKVAFITGAARGQGRSHAVRFAEEGADIIAFDLCEQMPTVPYPMSSAEDLDETVNLVEKTGRRIVAERGDVRDFERLKAAVANGVAELGRVDFVLANAGILPATDEDLNDVACYVDAVDVLLNGVHYTIEAALPHLVEHGDGGAIVITSSTAGLNALCPRFSLLNHGLAGYQAAKHGVVGLMRITHRHWRRRTSASTPCTPPASRHRCCSTITSSSSSANTPRRYPLCRTCCRYR
jgi:NAD(P)-dependent dehydrogenase (short-subunit alcohol dehydrogenase family)